MPLGSSFQMPLFNILGPISCSGGCNVFGCIVSIISLLFRVQYPSLQQHSISLSLGSSFYYDPVVQGQISCSVAPYKSVIKGPMSFYAYILLCLCYYGSNILFFIILPLGDPVFNMSLLFLVQYPVLQHFTILSLGFQFLFVSVVLGSIYCSVALYNSVIRDPMSLDA